MTKNQALWGSQTLRETLRFLRKRGKDLEKPQLDRLTEMILQGPPREMDENDLTKDEWNAQRDHAIFLRLHKLKESGALLSDTAAKTYDRIKRDQQWQPKGDHSEEFSIFLSGFTEYDSFDGGQRKNFSEMSIEQFLIWLNSQQGGNIHPWEGDDGWSDFVENNTKAAVELLKAAADKNVWISRVWFPVLFRCRTNEDVPKNLHLDIVKILIDMPIQPLDVLAFEAAGWLEAAWQNLKKTSRRRLWQKIWDASNVDECSTHELNFHMSVNRAGGILGNVLFKELTEDSSEVSPVQNTGFPRLLNRRFEIIADSETPSAKLARVRLSPMLFVLYRINPDWTKRTFLDRMDPIDKDKFDQYLWEGFFWHAQCPPDLLRAIKYLLFDILSDLDRIPKDIRSRAVELFTYLAVPPTYGINSNEARAILWKFGTDKLEIVAGVLNVMMRDADERALKFWNETLQPWFTEVWPTRRKDKTPALSATLAQMAIESGDAFPSVVEVITDKLISEQHGYALFLLGEREKKNQLVSKYPEAALTLIDKIFHEGSHISVLRELLNAVGKAEPSLKDTKSFKRLSIML